MQLEGIRLQFPEARSAIDFVNAILDLESDDTCLKVGILRWKMWDAWKRRGEPPGEECLKINIDGAFRRETSAGSCSFIIRNGSGDPLMARAANLNPVRDAMMAETVAYKFALELA